MVEKITNSNTRKSSRASRSNATAVKVRTERNRLAFLKVMIVFALILIQVAILTVTHLFLMSLFKWYIAISFFLSLATSVYILSSNKNSQSKAVWILFVLVCFSFGFIIYFMSDERFSFYFSRKRYNKILKDSEIYNSKIQNQNFSNKSFEKGCEYLKNVGGFETYPYSNANYFATGTRLYESVLAELEKAKHFIFLEYYIISDGYLLSRILDILYRKASEGVDVRILYDDLGCLHSLSYKTKKQMKKAGIKLGRFNPLVSRFSVALNFRDHRKIVVVDGKVAFTGGANLADEYVNEKRMHGYWKDSGIKITGLAVDGFVLAFLRQWQFVTHQVVDYSKFLGHAEKVNSLSNVVPFVDGLNYENRIGKGLVESIISNANEKLWIMTPYFIPDDTIRDLLIQKAYSGVDVRIVLPEVADKKFVYVVSRSNAEKLLKSGVKLYTMKNSFVHSKVVLSENSALVGSINIDLRSFYQQFESAVFTDDKSVKKDVITDFENVFKVCTIITQENCSQNKLSMRILAGLFRIISPFM